MTDALEQVVPEGWVVVALGDGLVADVQPGFACGVNTRDEVGIPHLRPMNVSTEGLIAYDDVKHVSPDTVDSERKRLRQGDVLFNNTNSAELVGKTALYNDEVEVAFSNHMTRVRCSGAVLPKYCALALHQKWREGYFLQHCNRHVSQASIGQTVLKETVLPLPPLAEQRRIVAKVEALLSRVRSVRQRLAAVPGILKHFRQAVLAHACSGKLTEDWRDGCDSEETGKALLALVRQERKTVQANGKHQRRSREEFDPSGKSESVDWDVPPSWGWARINDLLHYERSAAYGVLQPGPDIPGGVLFVRICDLAGGTVILDNIKRIDQSVDKQYPRTRLKGGEVLVSLVGTIGRIAVAPDALAGANVARAIGMLPLCPHVEAKYLRYALEQPEKNGELVGLAREVARKTLNLGLLKAVQVPLPPLAEQREIIRCVDALFVLADSIERRVQETTKRSEVLTQSILAKAFRGELVPTEADLAQAEGRDYETAEQLLARIREELAQRKPEKKTRRKTSKRKKVAMKKLDSAGVQKAIQGMPADTFSFADLHEKLPGNYDVLKDILFALLEDSQSGLEQIFDEQAKAMRFHRRTKA